MYLKIVLFYDCRSYIKNNQSINRVRFVYVPQRMLSKAVGVIAPERCDGKKLITALGDCAADGYRCAGPYFATCVCVHQCKSNRKALEILSGLRDRVAVRTH